MSHDLNIQTVLDAEVTWTPIERGGVKFSAEIQDVNCQLRMNDFPEEPLYTLYVGNDQLDLNDPPSN